MSLKALNPKLEWGCQLPVEAFECLFKPVSDSKGRRKKTLADIRNPNTLSLPTITLTFIN